MTKRCVGLLVALVLVAAASGCGEKGPPPGPPVGTPSPVHGRVTLPGGTPLNGGMVTFKPLEVEGSAGWRYEGGALVDAKGEYKAGQSGNGAGLVPGEYKVVVAPRDYKELAGSNSAQIPKPYQSATTTPLTVTIEAKENVLNVQLK